MKFSIYVFTCVLIFALTARAVACPPGSFVGDDSKCIACKAHFYQPNENADECIRCPEGSNASIEGATACAVQPGHYLQSGSFAGADATVAKCEAGHACAGSTNDVVEAGRAACAGATEWSDAGASKCETCPTDDTSYVVVVDSKTHLHVGCQHCDSYEYKTTSGCVECPRHAHASNDTTTCMADRGYYLASGSLSLGSAIINECEAGFECYGGDLEHIGSGRNMCRGWEQFSRAGADYCSICSDRWYVIVEYGLHTDCKLCEAGHRCVNGETQICPANTFSGTGADECTRCPAFYSSPAGADECLPTDFPLGLVLGVAAGVLTLTLAIGFVVFFFFKRLAEKQTYTPLLAEKDKEAEV